MEKKNLFTLAAVLAILTIACNAFADPCANLKRSKKGGANVSQAQICAACGASEPGCGAKPSTGTASTASSGSSSSGSSSSGSTTTTTTVSKDLLKQKTLPLPTSESDRAAFWEIYGSPENFWGDYANNRLFVQTKIAQEIKQPVTTGDVVVIVVVTVLLTAILALIIWFLASKIPKLLRKVVKDNEEQERKIEEGVKIQEHLLQEIEDLKNRLPAPTP
ncbi:hypothetical protein KKA95_04500 [Patescibacteria group bacterium]|nr:hypothetical protein [Patescibacteria group bacterium]